MRSTEVRALVAAEAFEQIPRFCSRSTEGSVMHRKSTDDGVHLVSLGFKVPFEFRRDFKTYAAREGCTMNELLLRAFDALLARASSTQSSDADREIVK
jgi:hypothetical protein